MIIKMNRFCEPNLPSQIMNCVNYIEGKVEGGVCIGQITYM